MRPSSRSTLVLAALVFASLSGCAAYRVSSNVDPAPGATPSAAAVPSSGPVVLAEDHLPGRRYTEIGPVEVSVKKLTVFHKDPTREQANEALIEKARGMGANAVVNIKYTSGIGFTTWGYIDAKGTAVRLAR
ncbi:MAG: heavy metal-binding domain-containing protein [Burkholderiaceae bacterium]|nr:heavy metal-binding domain-containing protein [Burkholderiaceae bacterium]